MPCFLNDKAPLVPQLHFAYGLATPWAVHFSRARIALLGRTAVFNPTTVTHQVESCGLAFTIIARSQLDNTIPLILGHTLYGSEEVLKGTVYALGRGSQGWRRGLRHSGG